MIVNFIVHTMLSVIQAILGVLPTVPATPDAVVSGGNWVITTIDSVISVLRLVYGGTVLSAIVVIIVAMLTFEWIYHSVMWVIHKIPIINIH